jgi:hypothetical protein
VGWGVWWSVFLPADATAVVNVIRAIVAALKMIEAGRDRLGADVQFLALTGTALGLVRGF